MNTTAMAAAYDFAYAEMSIDEIAQEDYSGDTKRVEQDLRYALKNPDEWREYKIKHG